MLAMQDSLVVNFGDFGLASATHGLLIRDLDAANDSEASPCGLFVIRCNTEAHQVLRAALTLITGYDKVRPLYFAHHAIKK
jgi:RNase P/RNase MRP subunit POP5